MSLVAEVAEQAAYDLPDVRRLPKAVQIAFIKAVVREFYNRTKNKSYKFKVFGIPVSVKISKIGPLIEWWLNSDGSEDVVVG